ncbi:MAG: iron-sulfur cluster insertion protein ErpA [Pseudomonadota bacterium]
MAEALQQPSILSVEEAFPLVQPITITENAANKVWELIQEEGNFKLKLRVFITGGGCSGFQYGFTFDESVNSDDRVISKGLLKKGLGDTDDEGGAGGIVQLLIDPMSLMYLLGAEIDYKSDLSGEQFIIRNPNAKTTCGCGASFAA